MYIDKRSYSNARIIQHIIDGRRIFSGKGGRARSSESLMSEANLAVYRERRAMYNDLFSRSERWCHEHQMPKYPVENRRKWRCGKCHYAAAKQLAALTPLVFKQQRDKYRNGENGKASRRRMKYKRRSLLDANPLTTAVYKLFYETYTYCLRCGINYNLSIDHIRPLALGGDSSFDNLQCLCMRCNSKKHIGTTDYRVRIQVPN